MSWVISPHNSFQKLTSQLIKPAPRDASNKSWLNTSVTKYWHFAFMSETIFRLLWSSYLITRLTTHVTIHLIKIMISTFVVEIMMFCIYVISVDVRHSCHNWRHFTTHLTTHVTIHKDSSVVTKYCYFVFMAYLMSPLNSLRNSPHDSVKWNSSDEILTFCFYVMSNVTSELNS